MGTQDDNTFKTKDLYEAAALMASGCRFLDLVEAEEMRGNNVKRFFRFVFDSRIDCEQLSELFWRGELTGNFKKLTNAIQTLKDRMYARQGNY